VLPQTDVARRGVVLVVATLLSFLFLVPTALAVSTSVAAASTVPGAGPPVLSLSHTPEAHTLSDTMNVNISMEENAGLDVIVNSTEGVSAPGVPSAAAVRFHQTGTTWEVDTGPGCAGPWNPVLTNQTTPLASPLSGGLLQLCVASGSPTVHGTLTAVYNSLGQARTVNTLGLEQYVADTVPGESPSSWATLGGAGPQGQDWGFQELEAQAVAVRSYVLSDLGGYGGYADTCDLDCQTYRGIQYETPTSIAAANDTAGQVMVMPNGSVATTEYSSSTGGYTSSANQQSPFTPVPDDGDAVSINPNHHWTAQVSYTAIQNAWPQIGTFTGFGGATSDPGHPYDFPFGRVDTIILDGTSDPSGLSVPGAEFFTDLEGDGVLSDLFTVTSNGAGEVNITGQGWGHGIGMGQYGALGYAIGQDNGDGNFTYQQIVSHYYAPATLSTLANVTTLGASGGVGGYWIDASDGGVFSFGNAHFFGSMGGKPLNQPMVGMVGTHDAQGYWTVAADGGVFSFGDARFYGSTGNLRLNKPVVGMAATPDGNGYWLVASDGGIFAYGDAGFYGSTGSLRLNKPIIGMVPTHDGNGYWLVASDGGIFAFGDAGFYGSLGSAPPPTPIVGVAPSPDGGGYWMLEASGTAHAFGDAQAVTVASDSPPLSSMKGQMTGLIPDYSGGGFDSVNAGGQAFAYGDAPYFGDVTTAVPGYSGHVVGIAVSAG
jgi:peptidoglycan hydrolase-like amidase